MNRASTEHIVEFSGITKRFPGVLALDNVSAAFLPGEVHAAIGENGAGKSTLMNILAGDSNRPTACCGSVGTRPFRFGA